MATTSLLESLYLSFDILEELVVGEGAVAPIVHQPLHKQTSRLEVVPNDKAMFNKAERLD